MKKSFQTLFNILPLIVQLVFIAGFFWYIKNSSNLPSFSPVADANYAEAAPAAMKGSSGGAEGGDGGGLMSSAEAGEPVVKAKIIKTARINLSTDKLDEGKKIIAQILPEFKAYTINEEEGKDLSSLHLSMTIRVPADQFDALVSKIISSGFIIDNKSTQMSDVTEQYIDVEVRLKNKKILIEKYTALLSKSQKIADTLEINRQLESTTAEYEALEGQMKYLNNQIALSTVDLYIVQRLAPTEQNPKSFLSELSYQIKSGVNALRETLLFLFGLWPFIIIVSIAGFFAYRRFKK
ncbi:MAG: DUF4349 domain-containing protein [Bacteriovorax sp.]|jgi:hypothetical protein